MERILSLLVTNLIQRNIWYSYIHDKINLVNNSHLSNITYSLVYSLLSFLELLKIFHIKEESQEKEASLRGRNFQGRNYIRQANDSTTSIPGTSDERFLDSSRIKESARVDFPPAIVAKRTKTSVIRLAVQISHWGLVLLSKIHAHPWSNDENRDGRIIAAKKLSPALAKSGFSEKCSRRRVNGIENFQVSRVWYNTFIIQYFLFFLYLESDLFDNFSHVFEKSRQFRRNQLIRWCEYIWGWKKRENWKGRANDFSLSGTMYLRGWRGWPTNDFILLLG